MRNGMKSSWNHLSKEKKYNLRERLCAYCAYRAQCYVTNEIYAQENIIRYLIAVQHLNISTVYMDKLRIRFFFLLLLR